MALVLDHTLTQYRCGLNHSLVVEYDFVAVLGHVRGGMFARRTPSELLCMKCPISSPKFIPT